MKQISILKQGVVTNRGFFDTEEKAMEWLNSCLAKNKFGLPERFKEESLCTEEEISSSLGVETRPSDIDGTKIFHKLPAEFEAVIEDYIEPYSLSRAKEYAKIDQLKAEAFAEFLTEDRTEKLEEYKALRAAIKIQFPKPS